MPTPAQPRRVPLQAADVMTPSPRTCSPFSTVLEAVLIFRDAGEPIGILTDRDVALALATFPDIASRPVSDVMTKGAVTVAPTTPLDEVQSQFMANGVRRLLVADPADRQLVGIVAWADVAPYVSDTSLGEVVTETVHKE